MGFLRGLADWFRNNVPVIGPPIADAIEGIERGIEDWARRLWEAADAVFAFFGRLWIGVSEAASRFAALVQDWWWRISWFFSELWNNVVAFFGWVWDSFRNWVSDRIKEFSDWLNNTGKWLSDTLSGLKKAWEDFVKDPWGTISKAINQIWSAIYDRVKPFFDEINGRINDVRNWFNDRIRDLSNALESARRELESRINELSSWARSAVDDINRRFGDFAKWATDALNNLGKGLEDITRRFGTYVAQSIVIWEAAKGAARKRVAEEIASLIENPESQAALIGGETAAWMAHPALGAAVTGSLLGLEAWSTLAKELPVGVPVESDNPVVKQLFKEEEVKLEGAAEYSFGELLASNPGVVYRWPDVAAGKYELEIVSG
jgi:hypothetical protein